MRLGALTGTSEDVCELAKTLKIARPSVGSDQPGGSGDQSSLPGFACRTPPRHAVHQSPAEQLARSGSGNLMLIAVVILALLGIATILVA